MSVFFFLNVVYCRQVYSAGALFAIFKVNYCHLLLSDWVQIVTIYFFSEVLSVLPNQTNMFIKANMMFMMVGSEQLNLYQALLLGTIQ